MVAAPCPCHGRSDFLGGFAQSIVDGKLVPQSPYAGRLSDAAYNFPLQNPKNRRYPLSGDQFAAMYSSYGYAASLAPAMHAVHAVHAAHTPHRSPHLACAQTSANNP